MKMTPRQKPTTTDHPVRTLTLCSRLTTLTTILSPESSPHFEMSDWPVGDRSKEKLTELVAANTHTIQPLPAYDIDGNIISPDHYETKLRGATVLVAMAFTHRYIKKNKRHVFTALPREIAIVRRPSTMGPSSPYKRRKLTKSLMTNHKGKGVSRSNETNDGAYIFFSEKHILIITCLASD